MRMVTTVMALAAVSLGQSNVERHIVWERVFDSVPVSGILASSSAVSDETGGVWIAVDHPRLPRVVHISASGELLSNEPLPDSLLPRAPSDVVEGRLASVSSGQIAVLADYSHAQGKTVSSMVQSWH